MKPTPPSDRTRVKRLPDRGAYDKQTVYSILDEGLVCHVGFSVDGQPYVIPMAYARDGDRVILHGSAASRAMRALGGGADLCFTVTHLDGLVLARSAFHHSMNYRSVVVLGKARTIDDPGEKREAFRRFFERMIPGRWSDVREPNEKELRATTLIEIPLEEASAKLRVGPPKDDDEDYALPVWAGVIPLATSAGRPIDDPELTDGTEPPRYASEYGADDEPSS
jgi:nitroimidazol reductase NimA-like FMN-containing flavoprotein (pyridoxamine 5'-phosphate oxidase superfamily)